ncbi:hypothetical protein FG465_003572 [Yersinia enterocolitica]|nr:hypothetical protein [Yersinia enterocolitica]EKN5947481.1 hypothetical protein [Yersinia enterocolitica]ELW7381422.1 hypothetical protein [Yersinia enterocolitica]HEI6777073.1 hypothetical protein [Yersinia enterocolitica]HEI6781330.1 hypothetical protein [Yersinia enterocolitica]
MNKDKIIDICALCLNMKELRDSHFLPKFVYRTMNKIKKDKSEKVLLQFNRNAAPIFHEIKKYLLCECCEAKLNLNGEDYVARLLLKTNNQPTKIHSIYSKNMLRKELFNTSNIEGLDNKKIFYFATSIFWRATFEWYGSTPLILKESSTSEMRQLLTYDDGSSSYIIICLPLFLFEQHSIIFPKKYHRKDIFNGDFHYFTIFNMCFIMMQKETANKYFNLKEINNSVCHMMSDILQIGIMKEFILNYSKKNIKSGMKYSTEVSWALKYIYNNIDNYKGNYTIHSDIKALITLDEIYKYFHYLSQTGAVEYWKTYINHPKIENVFYTYKAIA